eukprot:4942309-Pyramimonas_sp.AAC.1
MEPSGVPTTPAGIFSRRTNRTYTARVYSRDGPIGRITRGYILVTDQSDAKRVGVFSRRTNRTRNTWVYSHDGPIKSEYERLFCGCTLQG